MTKARAKTMLARIDTDKYKTTAYSHMNDFVKDVAALVVSFPDEMVRKTGKTTVRQSLECATSPANLEYIQNIGRFGKRHPDVQLLSGTSHNEAYHMELKAFWRNVMSQSAFHAKLIAKVATTAKLLALLMGRTELTFDMEQVDLIKAFLHELQGHPLAFDQPLCKP